MPGSRQGSRCAHQHSNATEPEPGGAAGRTPRVSTHSQPRPPCPQRSSTLTFSPGRRLDLGRTGVLTGGACSAGAGEAYILRADTGSRCVLFHGACWTHLSTRGCAQQSATTCVSRVKPAPSRTWAQRWRRPRRSASTAPRPGTGRWTGALRAPSLGPGPGLRCPGGWRTPWAAWASARRAATWAAGHGDRMWRAVVRWTSGRVFYSRRALSVRAWTHIVCAQAQGAEGGGAGAPG